MAELPPPLGPFSIRIVRVSSEDRRRFCDLIKILHTLSPEAAKAVALASYDNKLLPEVTFDSQEQLEKVKLVFTCFKGAIDQAASLMQAHILHVSGTLAAILSSGQ